MQLDSPWLVAVWPGMGGIARIAGGQLVQALGALPMAQLPPEQDPDVRSVRIERGLIQPFDRTQRALYGWKNTGDGPDLVIFVGSEQGQGTSYRAARELLDVAGELGVSRVVTFASMAAPIRPDAPARVFAAATEQKLLDEVRRLDVEILADAVISGLNGVLLAAAAERGLGGACLLGEFPFFASSVANPKASAAVLRRFAKLARLELDLGRLDAQAQDVERALSEHLRRLEEAAQQASELARAACEDEQHVPEDWPKSEGLDPESEARIEQLFDAAAHDRSKALALKAELDRDGVFAKYEDRFLDLFKSGE